MNESETHETYKLPPSLENLLDRYDGQAESERHSQGVLRTAVRGSHVGVTVRLRTWWTWLMDLQLSDEQLRRVEKWIRRTTSVGEFWLVTFIIAAVAFVAIRVVEAFLPGGAADRLIGGR